MNSNEPFLLSPAYKDYLWGGERLKKEFNKKTDISPLAESWECSTHPDGLSIVRTGINKDKTLDEVLKEHPEYLGEHPSKLDQFPILIKFIDAKKDLSVQVHPTDEYAREVEHQSYGKTEMWYVIDATEDAKLVYGFNKDVTKEQLLDGFKKGNFNKYLQRVKVKKGDMFLIPSGQVHAICAGALVAEIQENSNLTYRLYDYDRVGKDGKKRELHIDKALDVANLNSSAEPIQKMKVLRFKNGFAKELLCRCKYFQTFKVLLNSKTGINYQTDNLSFHVFLCYDGKCVINFNNESLEFKKGDCLFIPANSPELKLIGKASFLDVNC